MSEEKEIQQESEAKVQEPQQPEENLKQAEKPEFKPGEIHPSLIATETLRKMTPEEEEALAKKRAERTEPPHPYHG